MNGNQARKRPEFRAFPVTLMQCAPGNVDHAEGEQIVVLTIAKKDMSIEAQFYTLVDARKLVTKALVSLATYDDPFAKKLLDDHFSADDRGHFEWPEDSPDSV